MRHLGVLAHSWEGGALCFRAFCAAAAVELGPHDHPEVSLDCIPMARSMTAWDTGDHDAIRGTLAESVQRLARAGADFFACPDNTAHMALERPGPPLALPGLHIADVVADEAARTGRRRVGILGTAYTMTGPIYPRVLAARQIEAVPPDPPDRDTVHRIIFDELVRGTVTDESRRQYLAVIDRLARAGCDAVALVCTEIPLLIPPGVSSLPTLDSTRLLAEAALGVALERRAAPTWQGG